MLSEDKVDMLETVETVLVVSICGSSTPESAVDSLAFPEEVFAMDGRDPLGEMPRVALGVSLIKRPLAKGRGGGTRPIFRSSTLVSSSLDESNAGGSVTV